ncbi:hypothetical protein F5880DRAFT_1627272 [Lentinula raphanica]|nr:hypothetical protein F5880DRAFT_1627272 [Lentinula raphanica]
MQLSSCTSKTLGQPAFVALLLSAIALAVPITGPEMYPTEPTPPGTLSASHDLAHRSDIVPQSTLDARTLELSADDRPLLLARAPQPGAGMSSIANHPVVQEAKEQMKEANMHLEGTYYLYVRVQCRRPVNDMETTTRALDAMLGSKPVHEQLTKALPGHKFVEVQRMDESIKINSNLVELYPLPVPSGKHLEWYDQYCLLEVRRGGQYLYSLWATLRLAQNPPHSENPYCAALGTYVKYPDQPTPVVTKWVQFKMGKVVQKEEDKVSDPTEHGSTESTQEKTL